MEHIDPEKAARVWQRVQGGRSMEEEDLLAMATCARTEGAIFLQLSRRFRGREGTLLRRLSQEELSHGACLQGMYQLLTGKSIPTEPVRAVAEKNTQAALRRCYGRQMQRLAAYEARMHDPEYGQVFQRLAQQARTHCQLLLTLIGNLQNK